MKIVDVFESKQIGTLYHHTSFINAIKIFKSNILKVGPTGYISFTRNKNFLNREFIFGLGGVGVELILDGDKLSNTYKITPYKYHNLDISVGDESEESTKSNIKNIKSYIKNIRIFPQYFPDSHATVSDTHKYFTELYRISGSEIDNIQDYINYVESFGIKINRLL